MSRLPLEGIRVLDFTWVLAGPFCTKVLADLGAEVIKVERYPEGDITRHLFLLIERDGKRLSSYYLNLNRGKKSICINLRSEKGREIIYKLVQKVDVVVENYQYGVMQRLGMDYETLKKYNPKIIYCSISAFGRYGPYKEYPGYDLLAQTLSGYIWGQADASIATTSIGDTYAALHAALAIVSALYRREKTGQGEYIDISMSDCLLHTHENILAGLLLLKSIAEHEGKALKQKLDEEWGGEFPLDMIRMGPQHPAYPGYGVYKCKNGYISIAILNNEQWIRLLKGMGPEYYEKYKDIKVAGIKGFAERLKVAKLVNEIIESWTEKHTCEEIESTLKRKDVDIPCLKVPTFLEILDNEHYKVREMFVEIEQPYFGKVKVFGCPIKMASVKLGAFKPSPRLGEHNDEVLKWLNYTDEEIRKLYQEGILYREE
jgi:CoA:oxalate CoA-transferase